MRTTPFNTLFFFLLAVSKAVVAKERLVDERGSRVSTSDDDVENSNPETRAEPSGSRQDSYISKHHHDPEDVDVVSEGVNNSNSISTRTDSSTKTSDEPTASETKYCTSSDETHEYDLRVNITYYYEMQTVVETNETKIKEDILPEVEDAIVNSILPCTTTAIGKRKQKRILRRRLNGRLLSVIGASKYPEDEIVDKACKYLSEEPCFVIKGGLSVFVNKEDTVEKEKKQISNAIKSEVNEYESNDKIVKLYYLEEEIDEANGSDESEVGEPIGKRKDRTLKIGLGLFVGIGALAAALAGVALRYTRRVKNTDDQTEIQTGGVQTYLDVDEQRNSFS